MPAKKRSAKKKLTEKERLAEAEKALRQTQKVLNFELKKVDDYVKALEGHSPFPF